METKDILKQLREREELTQEELAEKLFLTRQAVSRWETGETLPGADVLKQLSTFFQVSINTLLGQPRTLICQCCGMPLQDDGTISREPDGSLNEDYCKWCYTDGEFVYKTMDELVDFLIEHVPVEDVASEKAREYFARQLSELAHWGKGGC